MNVSDEEFKASYNPNLLRKQSTLVLRTSFHLINFILMGLCHTFDSIHREIEEQRQNKLSEPNEMSPSDMVRQIKTRKLDIKDFYEKYSDLCIYETGPAG